MKITQEQARAIYNLLDQINRTNTAITGLKGLKEKEPRDGIIPDKYSFSGSVRIEIPSWMIKGDRDDTSCQIYDISVADAILVLENHVVRKQKEYDELMETLKDS